jgi:hypothetical protein
MEYCRSQLEDRQPDDHEDVHGPQQVEPEGRYLRHRECPPLHRQLDVAGPSLEGGQVATLPLHAALAMPRDECSILASEGDVCAPWHKARQSTKNAPNFLELRSREVRATLWMRMGDLPARLTSLSMQGLRPLEDGRGLLRPDHTPVSVRKAQTISTPRETGS